MHSYSIIATAPLYVPLPLRPLSTSPTQIIDLSPQQARRNAFMLCGIHRSLNSFLAFYKSHMCDAGAGINLEKKLNMVAKGME